MQPTETVHNLQPRTAHPHLSLQRPAAEPITHFGYSKEVTLTLNFSLF